MKRTMPKNNDFALHPTGKYTGTITEIDEKIVEKDDRNNPGQKKEVNKIIITIQSDGLDGDPSDGRLRCWFTFSNNANCTPNFRKFREAVLDRPLGAQELGTDFDDDELLGKRITYRVDHSTPAPGTDKVYANIREGSVEPAGNAPQNTQPPRQQATSTTRPVGGAAAPQRVAGGPMKVSASQQAEDDLPFSLAFLLPLGGAIAALAPMVS